MSAAKGSPAVSLSIDDDAPALPLTPLLDIVFILVLFLIVAVNVAIAEAPVELPGLSGSGASAAEVRLSMDQAGQLWMGGERLAVESVESDPDRFRGRRVALAADRRAPLESFLRLSAALRKAGVAELTVVARPKN